jgi:hypothetical protein
VGTHRTASSSPPVDEVTVRAAIGVVLVDTLHHVWISTLYPGG